MCNSREYWLQSIKIIRSLFPWNQWEGCDLTFPSLINIPLKCLILCCLTKLRVSPNFHSYSTQVFIHRLFLLHLFIHLVYGRGGTCVEASRQLEGSSSFLTLSVSQVLNKGPRAWQQVPLLMELSSWPLYVILSKELC